MFRFHFAINRSLALMLVVVMLVVSGCQPIDKAKFENVGMNDTGKIEAWVPRHVILIGPNQPQKEGEPGPLDQAAERLGLTEVTDDGVELVTIGELIQRDFGPDATQNEKSLPLDQLLKQSLNRTLTDAQFEQVRKGDLVAKLFDFATTSFWQEDNKEESVINVIKEVESRQEEFSRLAEGSFVIAQPNYWLVDSDAPQTECMNGVGTADGGSIIRGGPFDKPAILTSPDPKSEFENQPAFERLTHSGAFKFGDAPTGEMIKVVILDTSPFANTTEAENFKMPGSETDLLRDVTHKATLTLPSSVPSGMKQHGLFVAGLIRTVAPSSDIELVRVLDKDGCGQNIVLASALNSILLNTDDFQAKLVLNFSLVYHRDPKPGSDLQLDPLTSIFAGIVQNRPNTVIVVAAGNEGTGEPPLYPAAYHHPQYPVLAVAGIDKDGGPSCFSNTGIVSAVAGQGTPTQCQESTDPSDKVISIMSDGSYAYWTGTSFATPLVSGLVARCLESGLSASQTISNLTSGSGQHEVTLDMCPPKNQ